MSDITRDLERALWLMNRRHTSTEQLRQDDAAAALYLRTYGPELLVKLHTLDHNPKRKLSKHGKTAVIGLLVSGLVVAAMGTTHAAWGMLVMMGVLTLVLVFEGGFIE